MKNLTSKMGNMSWEDCCWREKLEEHTLEVWQEQEHRKFVEDKYQQGLAEVPWWLSIQELFGKIVFIQMCAKYLHGLLIVLTLLRMSDWHRNAGSMLRKQSISNNFHGGFFYKKFPVNVGRWQFSTSLQVLSLSSLVSYWNPGNNALL